MKNSSGSCSTKHSGTRLWTLLYPYRNPSRNPTVKKQPAPFLRSLVYEPYHDSTHKLLRKIKTGICIWDPGFSDLFHLESLTSVKHGFPSQKPHWHLPALPCNPIVSAACWDQGSSPPLWKVKSKGAASFLRCLHRAAPQTRRPSHTRGLLLAAQCSPL